MFLGASWFDGVRDDMSSFFRDDGPMLLAILIGTIVAVPVVRMLLRLVERRVEKVSLRAGMVDAPRRLRAVFDVLGYLAVLVVIMVGITAILATFGVNTGALLASAGVLGFSVGFGAQTLVKDLLNGFFLLAEGQYTIGDSIEINGVNGVVERATLRTTSLRAPNGDLHIVASGDIRMVTNKSKGQR